MFDSNQCPLTEMDQTKMFVATVKAVRLQMKNTGRDMASITGGKCKPTSEFSRDALRVVSKIVVSWLGLALGAKHP